MADPYDLTKKSSGLISSNMPGGTGGAKPAPAAPDAPSASAPPSVASPDATTTPNAYSGQTQPKIEPVTSEVNQETDTVESRLNKLTDGSSKYVNLAREDAMRNANSRGLINSTMAAGAGTEAAIRNALPIAQQDATEMNNQRQLNQTEQNKFLMNEQSANLNKSMAAFESVLSMEKESFSTKLKQDLEVTLANVKLSQDMKAKAVDTIASITQDSQNQITEIGLSDRSAAAQASAIQLVEANRDAAITVWQDLLKSMGDWEWSYDLSPVSQSPGILNPASAGGGPISTPTNAAPVQAQSYQDWANGLSETNPD